MDEGQAPLIDRLELLKVAFGTLRELGMLYEDPDVPGTYLIIKNDLSPAGRLAKQLLHQGMHERERLAEIRKQHPRAFKRYVAEA